MFSSKTRLNKVDISSAEIADWGLFTFLIVGKIVGTKKKETEWKKQVGIVLPNIAMRQIL